MNVSSMPVPPDLGSGSDAEAGSLLSEWQTAMQAAEAEYETRRSEFHPPAASTSPEVSVSHLSKEDQAELKMMQTVQTHSQVDHVSAKALEYFDVDSELRLKGGMDWRGMGDHLLEEAGDAVAAQVAGVVKRHVAPPPLPKFPPWHYALDDESHGPVSEQELLNLLAEGTVKLATLVWNQTMSEWTRLADTPLAEKAAPAPPPLPAKKTAKTKSKSKGKAAATSCPSCGHATSPEDRFCPNCGGPLKT